MATRHVSGAKRKLTASERVNDRAGASCAAASLPDFPGGAFPVVTGSCKHRRTDGSNEEDRAEKSSKLHCFPTTPSDHAETPLQAYVDIAPILERIAVACGKDAATLRIYDPYYCAGRMKEHLASLGFNNVYNENVDFYAAIDDGSVPDYDVLVTNPPFSGDHIERLLAFLTRAEERGGKGAREKDVDDAREGPEAASSSKPIHTRPWFILMPQFIGKKAYYLEYLKESTTAGIPLPLYLGPKTTPYSFVAPPFAADDDSAVGAVRAANNFHVLPGYFQCVWFFNAMGSERDAIDAWVVAHKTGTDDTAISTTDVSALPQLTPVAKPTPAERRWRKKMASLPPGAAAVTFEPGKGGRSR